MMKESKHVVSRRHFAHQAAGAVAAVTLGGGSIAVAQVPSTQVPAVRAPVQMAPQTTAVASRKDSLAKLSNSLFNSPAERRAFLANPQAYANKQGLKGLGGGDLNQVKDMLASGFCCGGCGC